MSSASPEDRKLADVILEYAQGWCPRGLSDNFDGDESFIANTARDLLGSYDIIKTGTILDSRGCERIALQFPDSLLEDSFFVSAALEECLRILSSARDGSEPRTVFVLGDTSYGECCVDEVAAQHLDADVVIHYGNACLSPTRALPVLYVFPSHVLGVSVDVHFPLAEWVDEVVQAVPDAKRVVVLYDLELVHFVSEMGGQNHPRAPPRQVAICVGEPRVRLSSIVEPLGDVSNQLSPAASNEGCCKETVNSKGDDSGCCGMRENLGSENLRPRMGETTGDSEMTTREVRLSGNEKVTDGLAYCASTAKTTCGPLVFPSGTFESSRAADELDSARQSSSPERQIAFLWLTSRSSDDESIQMRNASLRYSSDCAGFFSRRLGRETSATDGNAESMETVDVGRLLRRRYGLVEKVRDAERIAIVAGTLGVSGNLAIIDRCKKVVERAGRRWYVVVVGKPSAPKLANFAEMDAFVLVACPQNALIDSREHLRPVLTPLELEVAMGARDWFGSGYSTDFADLFATPLAEEEDGGAITGSPGSTDDSEHERWQIASRAEWTVLSGGKHGAAQFLKGREWQGLDPDRDAEGVAVDELDTEVVEGRSGRAAGYVDEG